MKLNNKVLAHYLVGTIGLMAGWKILMDIFGEEYLVIVPLWTLWYIVMDQILHVVIKGEKISIVR